MKKASTLTNSFDSIDELRNQVINYSLKAFSILGFLTWILLVYSFMRQEYYGWDEMIIHTLAITVLIAITLLRHKINLTQKVGTLSALIVMVIITNFYGFGLLGNAKIFVAIFPIFLSFVLPLRHTFISMIIFLAIYALFGFFYSHGILTYNFDINDFSTNYSNWLLSIATAAFGSIGLLFVGHFFSSALIANYTLIDSQNKDLAEKEKKYRRLFENSNDAILVIHNEKYVDCNQKTLTLFGCSIDDILNHHPWEVSPKNQPDGESSKDKAGTYFTRVRAGEPLVFDWQHLKKDGTPFDVSISLNKMILNRKSFTQAVLRDITQKKKTEAELEKYRHQLENLVIEKINDLQVVNEELATINEELEAKNEIITHQKSELEQTIEYLQNTQKQLIQAEKMASIGLLTAGIAHEINNPLNFISSGVSGLEMEAEEILKAVKQSRHILASTDHQPDSLTARLMENDPDIAESVENIPRLIESVRTGVQRTINIVKGLRTFSRMDDEEKHMASLSEIIHSTLTILHSKYKDRITITTHFDFRDELSCYPGKLGQLFLNIIINAIQAIEGEGTITITTRFNETDQAFEISITDTGPGIPPELQQKIFDPFFTTKPVGQGTGLGLAISHGIVTDHNGKIAFQSTLGQGTRFTISLPKA